MFWVLLLAVLLQMEAVPLLPSIFIYVFIFLDILLSVFSAMIDLVFCSCFSAWLMSFEAFYIVFLVYFGSLVVFGVLRGMDC